MAYGYRKTRKTYAKKRPVKRRKATKRRAMPRAQRLEIRIVGVAPGVTASTTTLGKKSGRPLYARF